ncbi:FMN reductase [Curtobacterium luteum]|uniref:FMN reductase n=1 Tax=Curtobacterium luteum TaxID=33881 RepID=A0A8H9GBC2_9MICO|nr:CE1759 family FMN reductase [Curtobacterium luteum]MBM7801006.1 FMN reductase [Curtobacterium luteum]NUU50935.1 NADPH-dependent FMN reductase [Curtobacterium luteum]GGL06141.1 FMN reductase [Curtobacterium luteum]
MTTIAVVSAGLSDPSSTRLLADRLGRAAAEALLADGTPAEVAHVELRPVAHEIIDAMLTGFAAPALATAVATVVEADAVVFVTPVFTAGVSGLAKSFLDVVDKDALADMPVLLGATGGTARHSLAIDHALRPVFAYLRAAVVPTGVFAATDDWGTEGDAAALEGRIRRAGADLAWAVRASRRVPQQADALPATPDFASMLGGLGH